MSYYITNRQILNKLNELEKLMATTSETLQAVKDAVDALTQGLTDLTTAQTDAFKRLNDKIAAGNTLSATDLATAQATIDAATADLTALHNDAATAATEGM